MMTDWYDKTIQALQLNGKGKRTESRLGVTILASLIEGYGPRCHGIHPSFPPARPAHRLYENPLLRLFEPQLLGPFRKNLHPHSDGLCLRLGNARLSRKLSQNPNLFHLWRHPPIPRILPFRSSSPIDFGQFLNDLPETRFLNPKCQRSKAVGTSMS